MQINRYFRHSASYMPLCELLVSFSGQQGEGNEQQYMDNESQATSWVLRTLLGSGQKYRPKDVSISTHMHAHIHTLYRYWPSVQDISAKEPESKFSFLLQKHPNQDSSVFSLLPESCSESFSSGIKSIEHNAILKL